MGYELFKQRAHQADLAEIGVAMPPRMLPSVLVGLAAVVNKKSVGKYRRRRLKISIDVDAVVVHQGDKNLHSLICIEFRNSSKRRSTGRLNVSRPDRPHTFADRSSLFLRSRLGIVGPSLRHQLANVAHAAVDVLGAPSFPFAFRDELAGLYQLEAGAHAMRLPRTFRSLIFIELKEQLEDMLNQIVV